MWTVTRQMQWPGGDSVVEISEGGRDYTNPDALSAKYPDEFGEFEDPREAVEAAIGIAEAWKADAPEKDIQIATGSTGGATMPFEGEGLTEAAKANLRGWANQQWEALPDCDGCGGKIPGDPVTMWDFDDMQFCSESCAEKALGAEEELEEDEKFEEDEEEFEGGDGGGAPRASAYHRIVRAFGVDPTPPDAEVEDAGSVRILRPLSPAGAAWIEENVAAEPWQQQAGGGIAIEPRMVQDIIDGMKGDGLTVRASRPARRAACEHELVRSIGTGAEFCPRCRMWATEMDPATLNKAKCRKVGPAPRSAPPSPDRPHADLERFDAAEAD